MEWTKGILIVPALFLGGCGETYEATYSKPYVAVCSGTYGNFFTQINTKKLNDRVNDYIAHGYTVTGNLVITRREICQALERTNNE